MISGEYGWYLILSTLISPAKHVTGDRLHKQEKGRREEEEYLQE
jgi:hypothetical protein